MKKLLFITTLIFSCLLLKAQSPVKWDFTAKKINSKTYEIHLTARMEDGWHIYSQSSTEGGPFPTFIAFSKNPLLIIEGKTKEIGKLETHFEKLFGVEVLQFSNKVEFVQVVKLKANAKTSLTGKVEFMVCNDEKCLPPTTQKFSIALK